MTFLVAMVTVWSMATTQTLKFDDFSWIYAMYGPYMCHILKDKDPM